MVRNREELMTTDAPVPCQALAQVWAGDTLIAESAQARSTASPEYNGQILLPRDDVRMDLLQPLAGEPGKLSVGGGGGSIGWVEASGDWIGFDPKAVRIEMTDRRPGHRTDIVQTNRFPRWGDASDLLRLLDVQPIGEGAFEAPTYLDTRRNVVEGSHLLAQSIVAAAKTTPHQRVTSVHAIFSRPARFDLPLRFDVTAPRLGRSFSTLAVEASQGGKSIASALALTDAGAQELIRSQISMPDIPGPEACEPHDFGVIGRDCRFLDGAYHPDPDRIGPPEIHGWVRFREAPDEVYLQQALLAQFTGHMTIAAAMRPHKGFGEAQAHVSLSTAVLAITIALHEEPDLTDWLLYTNPAIYCGRGLAQGEGHVFARNGQLAASYTVQVMIRQFADDPSRLKQGQLM
jgi:acyl-CoA thioesterase-2